MLILFCAMCDDWTGRELPINEKGAWAIIATDAVLELAGLGAILYWVFG